MVLKEEKSYNF